MASSVAYCMTLRSMSSIQARPRVMKFTRSALDFSKGMDLSAVKPMASLRDMNSEDVAKMIPTNDMQSGASGGVVATQIMDHAISNWFNSDAVRNSSLGRTAHEVEQTMESDVAFGGHEPEDTKHSFKFAMRPTQTRAFLEYSGLTNAQLSYQVAQSRVNLEVREQVDAIGTQVVYNHINQPGDNTDMVSLRWHW